MLRLAVAEALTSFVKIFAVGLYAAWAVKIGVIDSDINLLFAAAMVALSTYGLWVIVKRISDYVVDQAEQQHSSRTNDDQIRS